MNKIFYTLLLSLPLCAMENSIVRIHKDYIQAPSELEDAIVFHDANGFSVVTAADVHQIPNHNLNKPLRQINREMLARILEQGYLRVKKYDNGELGLDAQMRVMGGGPICAWWAYGFAKVACWTAVGTAASAAVAGATVATGGSAGAAAVGGAMASKTVGLAATGIAAGSSVTGAGAGAAVVTAVGAKTVGAAAVATGSGLGLTAAIETASCCFAAIFAGPWCP